MGNGGPSLGLAAADLERGRRRTSMAAAMIKKRHAAAMICDARSGAAAGMIKKRNGRCDDM